MGLKHTVTMLATGIRVVQPSSRQVCFDWRLGESRQFIKPVTIPCRRFSSSRTMCSMHQHSSNFIASGRRKVTTVLRTATRALILSLVSTVLAIAAFPAFLSWKPGLDATVWLANRTIPGKISVRKANLGWRKPLDVEDISLEDVSGEQVARIQHVTSKSSLLSVVTGRAGLGDCTVSSLWMNLLEDENSGIPRISLALEPAHKLQTRSRPVKKKPAEATTVVEVVSEVKALGGNIRVSKGEILVPADAAAALGKKLLVDIFIGELAVQQNGELESGGGHLPVQVSVWSDCLQAQGAGYLNLFTQKVKLIKPIKVEMDLTPELGRLYLARVNPLLGYIVGPLVVDEDMPDVVLEVSPKDMSFPAEEYQLRFEPMRVVLARGPILDAILKLFSSSKTDEFAPNKQELTMETNTIQAQANVTTGDLSCNRLDVLIGGKLHVATWGEINWIHEKMNTEVAVPQKTLKDLLGLNKLPGDYHLQIPVKGTFEQPQIDIKAAVIRIAKLTLHQQGGVFAKSLLGQGTGDESSVPQPIDVLPWEL